MTETATIPPARRGELTPISRTATVLLILFSAWMWVEAVGFLALLLPVAESPGWLAGLTAGVRSYWWLAVAVAAIVAAGMIRGGLRRDRFRRAAIVAVLSCLLAAGLAVLSTALSIDGLIGLLEVVESVQK
jgi:hypothetical protein